jgi:hypothetical protein
MQIKGSTYAIFDTHHLTNIVLEVEGILVEKATYSSLVLSVGLFWIDRMWVSFSSTTLSTIAMFPIASPLDPES